jgi:hypothetical protein
MLAPPNGRTRSQIGGVSGQQINWHEESGVWKDAPNRAGDARAAPRSLRRREVRQFGTYMGHAPLGYDGVKMGQLQSRVPQLDTIRKDGRLRRVLKRDSRLIDHLGENGDREHFAAPNVLRGLHNGRQAYAVECTLQDRLEVAGITGDPGNGDDHVEYLFEGEVATDLLSALR